jgi:hypothetical protein
VSVVHAIDGSIYHAVGQGDSTLRFNFDEKSRECAGLILDPVRIVSPYEPDPDKRGGVFTEWLSISIGECPSTSDELRQSGFWFMPAGDVTRV